MLHLLLSEMSLKLNLEVNSLNFRFHTNFDLSLTFVGACASGFRYCLNPVLHIGEGKVKPTISYMRPMKIDSDQTLRHTEL